MIFEILSMVQKSCYPVEVGSLSHYLQGSLQCCEITDGTLITVSPGTCGSTVFFVYI